MDERKKLFREYGIALERILDMHGIEGDRSIAKNILHKSLKKSLGIQHLSRLSQESLRDFIDQIYNFFPIEHEKTNNGRDRKS